MVYCTNTDVYRVAGITSSDVPTAEVDEHILEAQEMLNRFFNTVFESRQLTQTLDGNGTDTLYLDFRPLVTLDSLTIDGTSVTTSKLFKYTDEGKIVLKDTAEETVFKNTEHQQVVIQYTYGYNWDFTSGNIANNPEAYFIRKLCANRAAVVALVSQIGGTFDDVTSYQLPELSASKGEPFTNIRETIQRLQDDWKRMTESEQFKSYTNLSVWL